MRGFVERLLPNVMGAYTAFNAESGYDDADKIRTPFQNDPLFYPDRHITKPTSANNQ